jgi:hypothetical protein
MLSGKRTLIYIVSDAAAGNTKVCIIDSGYDLGHPDLQSADVDGSYDSGTGTPTKTVMVLM